MKTTNQKPIIDTLKKEIQTCYWRKPSNNNQRWTVGVKKWMCAILCDTLLLFLPSVKLLMFGRRTHLLECLDTLKYRPFGLDRHLSRGSADRGGGSAHTKMIAACRAAHVHSLMVLGALLGRRPYLSGSDWDSALTTGWRWCGFPVQQHCHRTQLSSLSGRISAKHS